MAKEIASNDQSYSKSEQERLDEKVSVAVKRATSYSPTLPAEVVEMIAKNLTPKDLLNASAVASSWRAGCQK
jgi:hypothetical protein